MILDKRTEFCDAVALNTGAPATFVIGDQIDLGTVGRDIGNGEPLYVVIEAATGINAAGAGTVQFQVVSADNAALTTNPVVHMQTTAFVTSTTSGNAGGALAAGTTLAALSVPMEGVAYRRFLGIRQVTGAQAITAGAVDAFLVHSAAQWKAYDAPFQA
jgi:hypothetical protein